MQQPKQLEAFKNSQPGQGANTVPLVRSFEVCSTAQGTFALGFFFVCRLKTAAPLNAAVVFLSSKPRYTTQRRGHSLPAVHRLYPQKTIITQGVVEPDRGRGKP